MFNTKNAPVIELPFVKAVKKTVERNNRAKKSGTKPILQTHHNENDKFNTSTDVYSSKGTFLSANTKSSIGSSINPMKKSNSEQNHKTIFNLTDLSTHFKTTSISNIYTDFKPRFQGVEVKSNDASKLLKRPGSYRHFWMKDKSEEVKTNVANKRQELDRLMDDLKQDGQRFVKSAPVKQTFNGQSILVHSANAGDVQKRSEAYLKNFKNDRSVSFDPKVENTRPNVTVNKLHDDEVKLAAVNVPKQNRAVDSGYTKAGERIGKINSMTKMFTKSKRVPMYAKGVSSVGNKFRDAVAHKNLVQKGDKYPRIYREDGQRVFRVCLFLIFLSVFSSLWVHLSIAL